MRISDWSSDVCSSDLSIASIGLSADAFRYVAFKELLEVEAGIATNEPDALALQQAIEAAVYGLVIEGASRDLWCLSTQPDYSENLLRQYFARRDNMDAAAVELARRVDGSTTTGARTAGYTQIERKDVGVGKRGAVRVDLGGGRSN